MVILGAIVGGQDDAATTKPDATPAFSVPPVPSVTSAPAEDATEDAKQAEVPEAEEPSTASPSTEAAPAVVPDVVGMNHADAMRELHAAGFFVDEESISPGNIFIVKNSNWQVCRQDPGSGVTDDFRVTIYSVKLDESC